MDSCHCLQPVLDANSHESCVTCGLPFDLKSWERDSRVLEAKKAKLAEARHLGFASLDGKVPIIRQRSTSIDVYSICPCGSGKKIKFCHGLPGLQKAIEIGKMKLDQAQREIKEVFPTASDKIVPAIP